MVSYRMLFCVFLIKTFPLFGGNRLYIGPTPDFLEPLIVSLIDTAHTRVWVAMYRLTAAPCVHALVRAKERGVDVRIILDRQQLHLPTHAVVRRHLSRVSVIPLWGGPRSLMHHKWAVIDNRVITGSANWTRAGLTSNHEINVVLDDAVNVQRYVTHFVALTRRRSGLATQSPPSAGVVFFVPDHRKALQQQLGAALAAAQSRIWIALYSLTRRWCWEKLTEAVLRGVSVKIILEPSEIARPELSAAAAAVGVQIKKYHAKPDAIIHDKCALIDDAVWLGSMNWTGAGMRTNDENLVVVRDAPCVAKVERCFTQLFDRL